MHTIHTIHAYSIGTRGYGTHEGHLLIVSLFGPRLSCQTLPSNEQNVRCKHTVSSFVEAKPKVKIYLTWSGVCMQWFVVWLSWSRQSVAKVNCSFEHHHPSLLWATISTIHHHANASDCRALLFGVKIMFLIVFVMILWWRGWIRHFIIFNRTKMEFISVLLWSRLYWSQVHSVLNLTTSVSAEFTKKILGQLNLWASALS